jgi:hypothetical protein
MRRRHVLLAAAIVAVAAIGGCSGDDSADPGAGPTVPTASPEDAAQGLYAAWSHDDRDAAAAVADPAAVDALFAVSGGDEYSLDGCEQSGTEAGLSDCRYRKVGVDGSAVVFIIDGTYEDGFRVTSVEAESDNG